MCSVTPDRGSPFWAVGALQPMGPVTVGGGCYDPKGPVVPLADVTIDDVPIDLQTCPYSH